MHQSLIPLGSISEWMPLFVHGKTKVICRTFVLLVCCHPCPNTAMCHTRYSGKAVANRILLISTDPVHQSTSHTLCGGNPYQWTSPPHHTKFSARRINIFKDTFHEERKKTVRNWSHEAGEVGRNMRELHQYTRIHTRTAHTVPPDQG